MNTKPRTRPTINFNAWFKRVKGVEFVNRSVKLFLARKRKGTDYSDKHDENEHLLACAIDSLEDDTHNLETKHHDLETKHQFDKIKMIIYSTALFVLSIATSIILFLEHIIND